MLPYTAIAKAACVITTGASFIYSNSSTPASKEVQSKKDAKLVNDGVFEKRSVASLTNWAVLFGVAETSLYVLFMMLGPSLSGHQVFQQFRELKTWHLVSTAICLSAFALRKWSFDTLGRHFTFQLTIRSAHKLIQDGPYRFLRHPSYTAVITNACFFQALVLNKGLFDVLVFIFNKVLALLGSPFNVVIAIPYTFLGRGLGTWYSVLVAIGASWIVVVRIKNEEGMLKEHFGKEWDLYASKRWRFIPFIY